MSATHTPGPWQVEAAKDRESSWYVQDAIGEDVCRVRGGETTSQGNARLIAAAPELLQALSECAAVLGQLQDAMPIDDRAAQAILVQGYTGAAIVKARALIARIEAGS